MSAEATPRGEAEAALEGQLDALDAAARGAQLDDAQRSRFVQRLRAVADGLEAPPGGRAEPAAAAAAPARHAIVGDSPPVRAMLALVDRLAATDVPVLVRGETGTGKEGVARRLHAKSARAKGPFVAVDCGAIAPTLIESELFGHVRGSFTGADRDRPGHFLTANGGTLVLDEVGELPLDLQPKLLRVLQDNEVRPVGGDATSRVDVRVVAATNRDLARECDEGRFRQDLYYRLAVVEVVVPPLRERTGDLPLLAAHLLARIADESHRPAPTLTPAALERLAAHRWPGNVRELENTLRRAVALGGGAAELDADAFEGLGASA